MLKNTIFATVSAILIAYLQPIMHDILVTSAQERKNNALTTSPLKQYFFHPRIAWFNQAGENWLTAESESAQSSATSTRDLNIVNPSIVRKQAGSTVAELSAPKAKLHFSNNQFTTIETIFFPEDVKAVFQKNSADSTRLETEQLYYDLKKETLSSTASGQLVHPSYIIHGKVLQYDLRNNQGSFQHDVQSYYFTD